MDKFQKFIPITKVEEQADGTLHVYGVVTAEQPDRDNEVCNYETTVPYYKKTVEEMLKATDVPGMESSIMPIREMHQLNAVGKGISIDFDDVSKTIRMGAEIVAAETIKKVKKGVLPCFSQGGNYVKKWPSETFKGCMAYTADPGEISLVDRGCLPGAVIESIKGQTFAMTKANGSIELVKYDVSDPAPAAAKFSDADAALIAAQLRKTLEEAHLVKEAKTKRKGGKDLTASDFAYVGDPDDTSTWKLPIHDAAHARNALARFNQTEGIPADEKGKVKAKIKSAAKKFGIDVADEASKIAKAGKYLSALANGEPLEKGLWSVADLAQVAQTIAWLHSESVFEREMEGDASTQPEDLQTLLQDAISCLTSMVEEETSELLEHSAAAGDRGATAMKTLTNDELNKAAKSVVGHLKDLNDMHKKFHKSASECVGKCAKALGADSEEWGAGGEGPTQMDPVTTAAGDAGHVGKAELAELETRLAKKLEDTVGELFIGLAKSLGADETERPDLQKGGIGDRSLVSGGGPSRTELVNKGDDVNRGTQPTASADAPVEITPELIRKANGGDPVARLALARSVKAMGAADANRVQSNLSMAGMRQ